MSEKEETIMVIKDVLFERVIMGTHVVQAMRDLHFIDGYEKDIILEAHNQMVQEVKG